jgi:hypothetical protein
MFWNKLVKALAFSLLVITTRIDTIVGKGLSFLDK